MNVIKLPLVIKGNLRPFVLTFYLFITSCIWLIISPLGSSPDEYAHVQYSWAITDGQYLRSIETKKLFIPQSLNSARSKSCMAFEGGEAEITTACQTRLSSNQNFVYAENRTLGYPPLFYYIVGLPTQFGFSELTWYVMRLLSIIGGTCLFGLALYQSREILDSRIYFGILLALSPMVSYFLGSVNPSGLEIVSGLSLSLLLASAASRTNNYPHFGASWYLSIFVTSFVLSLVRPYSWMFVLGIFLAFAIFAKGFLNKSKSNLNIFLLFIAITIPIVIGIFERFYVRGLIAATTNRLDVGSSLGNADDDASLINNIIELILKNFVGFDDWIYISIGQFGYLDHRGLNLVAAAWSGLIYLALIFSIQRTNLWSKIGIFTIVIGATIVSPLAAYQFSGLHEGGYQVRYGMALICSIPIFTALNSVSNLFNIKEFRVIVLWLIPIAMISDWFISWYRYSHGLPFRNFTEGFEKYDSWIGWELRSILTSLLILFILTIIAIFKIEKYELANQSSVSK